MILVDEYDKPILQFFIADGLQHGLVIFVYPVSYTHLTYLDEGRWDKIYHALQPGDFVLIQFGHNDAGDINTGKAASYTHLDVYKRQVYSFNQ